MDEKIFLSMEGSTGRYVRWSDHCVWQPFGDTLTVVMVIKPESGLLIEEMSSGVRLNAVGRDIWDFCDGTRTVEGIIQQILEQYEGSQEKIRLIIAVCLLGALIATLVLLAFTGRLGLIWDTLREIFSSREHTRVYVESWGSLAPAVFIGLQALQVVLARVPGELTGAVGGFIFGGLPTILYSTIGLTIGSIIAFLGARIIGQPLVKLVVNQKTMDRFYFLTQSKGKLLALILFLIPGFPKDILSYILGLSPMRFVPFVIVCLLGRIPGTVMLSFSGSALYNANWTFLAIMSTLCLVIILIFFLNREKIEAWLQKAGKQTS